jgi:hypothetical protein
VAEEPAGGFTYYRVDSAATHGRLAGLWSHLQAQFDEAGPAAAARADDARLQEVLRQRRENFETHGTDAGQLVPGRSWAAWARALGHLLPELDVADIGCGDGHLTIEAATWARRIYTIDSSCPPACPRPRQEARRRQHRLEARRDRAHPAAGRVGGRGPALPGASSRRGSRGGAGRGGADPPAGRPRAAPRPAAATSPGGPARDHWLGFSDHTLTSMMRRAGLRDIRCSSARGRRAARSPSRSRAA